MTPLVWSYSESEVAANELSAAAEGLAKSVEGRSVALEVGATRAGVKSASKLLLKTGSTGPYLPEVVSEMIHRASQKFNPSLILLGANRQGREVAARLGAKMGSGAMSDSYELEFSGQKLMAKRNVFAGRVVAQMSASMPCVATVKLGAYPPSASEGAETHEFEAGDVQQRVKVLSAAKKESGSADLGKAKTIVSVGRGVKRKEDLPMVEELAKALGAALGCSRPLSSDLGWLPEECHIGLTGVSVRPDLYLAVGISGQLQHVAGIKDSRVIAAINSDREAPIFQAADYGVVGDLYQVVPALQRLLADR